MITSGVQEAVPEDAQDIQAYEHEAFEQVRADCSAMQCKTPHPD